MIDFNGKLVNPFNITYVEKQDSPLSGGVVRVALHLACGSHLVEQMTLLEYNELEETLAELLLGEEDERDY